MRVILIILIILLCYYFYTKYESFNEHFYSSGSSIRQKSEVGESTQKTIDTADFNKNELNYYLRR
jgi:hypothetical protein